ncbi:MAG: hypothetical protein FWE33_02185 [Defluviitaleaceae bacterium]|nr:hypothetical protein [Defluviitaleaceae bacterium]
MRNDNETQADRLRRRLQERSDRITNQRPRLNPFTLVSILIVLIVLFLVRNGS